MESSIVGWVGDVWLKQMHYVKVCKPCIAFSWFSENLKQKRSCSLKILINSQQKYTYAHVCHVTRCCIWCHLQKENKNVKPLAPMQNESEQRFFLGWWLLNFMAFHSTKYLAFFKPGKKVQVKFSVLASTVTATRLFPRFQIHCVLNRKICTSPSLFWILSEKLCQTEVFSVWDHVNSTISLTSVAT